MNLRGLREALSEISLLAKLTGSKKAADDILGVSSLLSGSDDISATDAINDLGTRLDNSLVQAHSQELLYVFGFKGFSFGRARRTTLGATRSKPRKPHTGLDWPNGA